MGHIDRPFRSTSTNYYYYYYAAASVDNLQKLDWKLDSTPHTFMNIIQKGVPGWNSGIAIF